MHTVERLLSLRCSVSDAVEQTAVAQLTTQCIKQVERIRAERAGHKRRSAVHEARRISIDEERRRRARLIAAEEHEAELQVAEAEMAGHERKTTMPDQSEPISEEDWACLPSYQRCSIIQRLRQTIIAVGAQLALLDLQVNRLVGCGANAAAYFARVNPTGRLGSNHQDILLVVKVIFNYHGVDTRTDARWIAKNKQEDVGEVRPDIVPVLATFDDTTDSLPGFSAKFPAAGCRHTTFLLQPFYSGGTLQGLVQRFNAGRGEGEGGGECGSTPSGIPTLPCPVVQSYLQQMLDAVMRLQKLGLAHRDVKSDNILLSGPSLHGCPTDLALGDFGEVGPLRLEYKTDGTVSKGGAVVALAPEVLAGIHAAAQSSVESAWLDYSKNDCWAVGVVAYEMATGRPPWAGDPPYVQEERRPMPEWCGQTVRDVLDRLLRIDHDERASVEVAFRSMLQVFSEG